MITKPMAGSALRLHVRPPAGATKWRILRRLDDGFTGESDAGALRVEESDDTTVLDTQNVVNGITYFYRPFYYVGGAWQPGSTASAVAAVNYEDVTPDVQSVVRDRLIAGLRSEVEAHRLVHDDGAVPVHLAPPAYEQARWPMVSVHMTGEDPAQRFVGEEVAADAFDEESGEWSGSEGWLAKTSLSIIGWSLNSDARFALRKALRRVVIANLGVFSDLGLVNVEFSQQDQEDFSNYPAPVYQVICTFTCLSPVALISQSGTVAEVTQIILS